MCKVSLSFSVHVPWLHRLDEERGRHAAETADAAEKAANTYEAARRCFVRKASVLPRGPPGAFGKLRVFLPNRAKRPF